MGAVHDVVVVKGLVSPSKVNCRIGEQHDACPGTSRLGAGLRQGNWWLRRRKKGEPELTEGSERGKKFTRIKREAALA